jgi:hypothetical protein
MPPAVRRRSYLWRYVASLRSGIGLTALGAMLGAGGFLLVDSLKPPQSARAMGGFSLRETYYATCREAFQDDRANIRAGEPGYRLALDADRDGVACEPYARRLRP